jgi:hypothetical protein
MPLRMLLQTFLLSLLMLVGCQPGQPAPPTVTPVATLPPLNVTFELGGQVFGSPAPGWLQEAGMTWMKRQVVYHPGDSTTAIGAMIQGTHSQGFKILLNIVGDPAQLGNNLSTYSADFAAFLAAVAQHNPDAIQVWNEPNIDRQWPAGNISGANYTAMLKAAYEAIKAANPNVMVISAAPAPTGFFAGACTASGCDDNVFIGQMAAAGAAQVMDCVGIHYNEGILSPDATSGDPRGNGGHYTRYYSAMVNLYVHTFPTRPLCFDELGYLTPEGYGQLPPGFEWASEVTLADHAEWLGRAATLSKQNGRIRLMIVWNVDSSAIGGGDPQAAYAILRPNGSCPACATLGAAMRG